MLKEAGQGSLPVAYLVANGAAQHPVVQSAPLGAVGAFGVLGLILLAGAGATVASTPDRRMISEAKSYQEQMPSPVQ